MALQIFFYGKIAYLFVVHSEHRGLCITNLVIVVDILQLICVQNYRVFQCCFKTLYDRAISFLPIWASYTDCIDFFKILFSSSIHTFSRFYLFISCLTAGDISSLQCEWASVFLLKNLSFHFSSQQENEEMEGGDTAIACIQVIFGETSIKILYMWVRICERLTGF